MRKSIVQLVLLVVIISVSGCIFVQKPSIDELRILDNPPPELNQRISKLAQDALKWYSTTEIRYLSEGRLLRAKELEKARSLGIARPEDVRVVILDAFPMPKSNTLNAFAKKHGLGSKAEGGRAIGNVVFLKPRYKNNTTILTHEFVHIAQHDRMGRKAFIKRYLLELEVLGYSRSLLELEAYEKQEKIQ